MKVTIISTIETMKDYCKTGEERKLISGIVPSGFVGVLKGALGGGNENGNGDAEGLNSDEMGIVRAIQNKSNKI